MSSSSPSSSNCRRSSETGDHFTSSTTTNDEEATDLSKLVLQEIGFVKESFEAVKIKASQKIDAANEAEKQFEELMVLPAARAEERDYKLRQIKMKVSKLRLDIPFKLIAPSEQPHPNIIRWRRPESNLYQEKESSHSKPDTDDDPAPPVPYHMIQTILWRNKFPMQEYVACFIFFPKNAVIKRRVIFSLLTTFLDTSNRGLGALVEKGLVEAVYKKSNLTVDGYRMHPSVHSYLRSEASGFREWANMYLGCFHDVVEKHIYHTTQDFEQFTNDHTARMKTVLHLGKWNNSTEQHIEVIDPELFFKHMSKYTELISVSLCGISMIEELPEFITKLEWLEFLDLRACHNLEVIPPSISNLGRRLKYLDISECYYLDHMPKALASLVNLRVLKGFVVGENTYDKSSCSLEELASLHYLVKLNIYTSIKGFPSNSQFQTLHRFGLRSLTISWGGCSAPKGLGKPRQEDEYEWWETIGDKDNLFPSLEKLDLQCVSETGTRLWLKPTNFTHLKKLYIRGGNFFDLGQSSEGSQWNVEMLRLKHLCKLHMDWGELQRLFPKLVCLEKVNCPNLHQFPCSDSGIWMKNQQA